MYYNKTTVIALLLSVFSIAGSTYAEGDLDVKQAEKLEIRHSMIGFRNTLIFYTFKEERAVLELLIDNKDETFPISGKVYLFDEATTEEGIKKWLNNQHSDGLFPQVPEPISTTELPKDVLKVTSHKQTGVTEGYGPEPEQYKNFAIEFSVKAHEIEKELKLSAFTDSAQVHVKSE